MEIVVAVIGLVGAGIGLVAACIPQRSHVVHHNGTSPVATQPPVSLGKLVSRSTLLGLSIGTFFGVLILGAFLAFASRVPDPRNEGLIAGLVAVIVCGLLGTLVGLRTGLKIAALTAPDRTRR
jgi:hypothetical protein